MNESFLRNQAGIIAAKLADGAPCPVCGSVEHPAPAKLTVGDVTEARLKSAKATVDRAQEGCNQKSTECAGLKSEIETREKSFFAEFSAIIPNVNMDTAGVQLTDAYTLAQRRVKELIDYMKNAEKKLTERRTQRDSAAKRSGEAEISYNKAITLAAERERHEGEQKKSRDQAHTDYVHSLSVNGFADEAEYAAVLVTEETLSNMIKRLADYEKDGERLKRDINRLEGETAGKERPDTEKLARREKRGSRRD